MNIPILMLIALIVFLVYQLGFFFGRLKQQSIWQDHMDKCNKYEDIVNDLDKWCSEKSPHAKVIVRYFRSKTAKREFICNDTSPLDLENINDLRRKLVAIDTLSVKS